MATEKLKINMAQKKRTNTQIKKQKTRHKLWLENKHDRTTRTNAFKFFTPLTPSVETNVNLHGFKQVYRPRNTNVLFS
jgi:hypothetical protein